MTQHQVAQHPASVEAYIRHGWSLVPIPTGTKGPRTAGWNQRQNALQSQVQLPPGYGIGLAHAYSGTMALDIDSWLAAEQMLSFAGIDLRALYEAPDAVVVDSGKQGHGKLLYAMPFGLALPSKKINAGDQTIYELRCATSNGLTVQDVLPPSIHPDTNQPYRWAGRGHWTRLPVIPMSLLNLWQSMLSQDAKIIAPATAVHADWTEIKSILEHLSPDCSRDEWITVGMALHYTGTSTGELDAALHLWNDWSKPSSKYPGEAQMLVQWRSFRSDKGSTVKLGSLYKLAHDAGWEKPMPDVSAMFSSTTMATPAQVTTEMRPPAPELDYNLVPAPLRDYAFKMAQGIGCDPMIPLLAGIAAVSAAVDARSRLELKIGFKVPPNLWIMTIGEPAAKKTHGATPMLAVFDALEKEDIPRYTQELQKFEGLEARHEAARKAFLDAAKDTENLLSGQMPQGYGDPPVKPVPLQIKMTDITSQMMVRQLADRPRGMLAFLDEMLSWSERVTDKNSGEYRSAWTQAFEAGHYRMDRVGAGSIVCENMAVSFYGNTQPESFASVSKLMAKDGMLQRFIPVMVSADKSRKGTPTNSDKERSAYESMIRLIFASPAMTYRLSEGAVKVYDHFQDWYYQRQADERAMRTGSVFMTAFGKMEGLTGRIALSWHMMTNPFSPEVSADTMERAISVVRDFVVPSLRYVHESESDGFDAWVRDYVIQYSDTSTITLHQIKQSARRKLDGVNTWIVDEMVIGAMWHLEQAGWVIRADDGSGLRRHHAVWAVNPAFLEKFEPDRKRVIEAKTRQREEIYRLSTKSSRPRIYGEPEPVDQQQAA